MRRYGLVASGRRGARRGAQADRRGRSTASSPRAASTAADFERMDAGQGRHPAGLAAVERRSIAPPMPGGLQLGRASTRSSAEAARQGIAVLADGLHRARVGLGARGLRPPRRAARARSPRRTPSSGLAAWRSFLGAAVAPLRPRRPVLDTAPRLSPETPIRAWQIWNEQNSPGFFQPHPDVDRYAELLIAGLGGDPRPAIPDAEIVLGGMFRYPLGGRYGGIRATELPPRALHPSGHRGRLRRGRDPSLRRAGCPASSVRSTRGDRRVRAAGDSQAVDLDHRGRLGLRRQADPAQPRPPGQARAAGAGVSSGSPANGSGSGSEPCSGTRGATSPRPRAECKWCARSGLFPSRLARSSRSPPGPRFSTSPAEASRRTPDPTCRADRRRSSPRSPRRAA